MIGLPDGLLEAMKRAALAAGTHALDVKAMGVDAEFKDDRSLVTRADKECEALIRKHLATFVTQHGFSFLGEESGQTIGSSDFEFVVDPIDGTTNYTTGDASWMVSIGVTYRGKPIAGVTYQPDLDKLYWAMQGQGAYLTQNGATRRLSISPAVPNAHIFETLFASAPDFGAQRALHSILGEWVPHLTENKQKTRYRSLGCPSVPLCMMAEGARQGIVAKPIYWHDIVASAVIAQEAGAEVELIKEDVNDVRATAPYALVAARRELFAGLKRAYDDTVGKEAYFYQSETDILRLKEDGIVYGISVGRRQPMHIVHLDCIREIAQAGLMPVIVIGSSNTGQDRYFDPLKNPLTEDQQREQIRLAMEKLGIADYHVLAIKDVGHVESWTGSLSKLLYDHWINARQSVFHFRSKSDDKQVRGAIVPLSGTQEMLHHYGFSLWQSHNSSPTLNSMSATVYRTMDLCASEHQSPLDEALVAPDYIRTLAQQARDENPDKHLLDGVPITLLDLSLARMHHERGISTATLLHNSPACNIKDIERAIQTALHSPLPAISGTLAATPAHTKGASRG